MSQRMLIFHRSNISHRFLPFEAILGTLLHELVHNSFGKHDRKFREKLKQVTDECEHDMLQKIKIVSFPSCAFSTGGDVVAMSRFSKRELALFAAESRLALTRSEQEAHDARGRTDSYLIIHLD
jgi:hypothetical protein